MKEFLPFAFGMLIGIGAMKLSNVRWRVALGPVVQVLAGAAASAINGELVQRGWLIFVTVDSLLVYLGAVVASTALAGMRWMREG